MFFWIRRTLFRQLMFLLIVTALASNVHYFWHSAPVFRLSADGFFLGTLAGVFASGFAGIAALAGLYFPRSRFRQSFDDARSVAKNSSLPTLLGAVLSAAAGEEYLLRGLIFGCLSDTHFALAVFANLAATFAGNWRGRDRLYSTLSQTLESCWYAALYYQRSSLTVIVVARFVRELAAAAALRTEFAARAAGQPRFSWRQLYGRSNTAHRVFRRV